MVTPSSSDRPARFAVLLSGAGRSLQNLCDHIRQGRLPIEIGLVVSSSAKALGVEVARRAGLPCEVIEPSAKLSAPDYSERIFQRCRDDQIEWVVMAGFLKHVLIPPDFAGRVLNIHPSLIPAFSGKGYYGMRVHKAVIEQGARISGCTVHFVDDEYDHGPIILQREVPVGSNDTPESLAARVFLAECEALPSAILEVIGIRHPKKEDGPRANA